MDRSTFIRAVAASLSSVALTPFAQPHRVHRVGTLSVGSPQTEKARFAAFTQGLAELGYAENRNLRLERRFAEGRIDRLPSLAASLTQVPVDAIMCMSTLATQAARKATATIPIVFATVADPVAEGFAESLGRPGRNLTGVSNSGTQLSARVLQLLKEAIPTASRTAVLTAPRAPHAAAQWGEVESAARALRVELLATQLSRREDIDARVAQIRAWRADSLYVMQGSENSAMREPLVELASRLRIPAIYPQKNYVESGGLLSYGSDFEGNYRRAASYVDKILRGARPGDLPIEQPATFELVVNLKTAKAIGVQIPHSVLLQANRVIE